MPTKGYIGDESGICQIVTSQYIGDENGVAQKVVKVYIGDENGVAQLCYAGAGVKVDIYDAAAKCYCVINGETYNNGGVHLELEIGTPIEIYMEKASALGGSPMVSMIRDMGDGIKCYEYQHIASKDADIIFTTTGTLGDKYEAVITCNGMDCFLMAVDADGIGLSEVVKGFSCRTGMTWRQLADSMYNNGHFSIGESGRVYYLPTNTIVKDPANGDAYVSADDYIIHKREYN